MTAERPAPDPLAEPAPPLAGATPFAITLVVIALAAAGGWLHTVRELNRIVAHEVVRNDALRQLRGPEPSRPQRPGAQVRRPGADD